MECHSTQTGVVPASTRREGGGFRGLKGGARGCVWGDDITYTCGWTFDCSDKTCTAVVLPSLWLPCSLMMLLFSSVKLPPQHIQHTVQHTTQHSPQQACKTCSAFPLHTSKISPSRKWSQLCLFLNSVTVGWPVQSVVQMDTHHDVKSPVLEVWHEDLREWHETGRLTEPVSSPAGGFC